MNVRQGAFAVISTLILLSVGECYIPSIAYAQQNQSSTSNSNQSGTVGSNSNGNSVVQNNPQIPINNINGSTIVTPRVLPLDNPLDTPVNTENDFGINLSAGVNTLDQSNVTINLGIIYQPGRTESHDLRMDRLRQETQLIQVQKQVAEAQLVLLKSQAEEAKIRLERLKQSPGTLPSPAP